MQYKNIDLLPLKNDAEMFSASNTFPERTQGNGHANKLCRATHCVFALSVICVLVSTAERCDEQCVFGETFGL